MTSNQADAVSGSGMSNVDGSEDPQARVNYLDAVTEQLLEEGRQLFCSVSRATGYSMLAAAWRRRRADGQIVGRLVRPSGSMSARR
ncbi:MAG: hypothetical protein R3A46_06965 [Thermomicrobiales bacterium]